MRLLFCDVETTGLSPAEGHRIVEIAVVAAQDRRVQHEALFHSYLNPERAMPAEAEAVHGLSQEFLQDYPRFADIAQELSHCLGDDDLLIAHNAPFDTAFLNAEFARCGYPPLDTERIRDSLARARLLFPNQPNSLDALCQRLGVTNSKREKHSALQDTFLLAEVYLRLGMHGASSGDLELKELSVGATAGQRQPRAARPYHAGAKERAAHRAWIATIPQALWHDMPAEKEASV